MAAGDNLNPSLGQEVRHKGAHVVFLGWKPTQDSYDRTY